MSDPRYGDKKSWEYTPTEFVSTRVFGTMTMPRNQPNFQNLPVRSEPEPEIKSLPKDPVNPRNRKLIFD